MDWNKKLHHQIYIGSLTLLNNAVETAILKEDTASIVIIDPDGSWYHKTSGLKAKQGYNTWLITQLDSEFVLTYDLKAALDQKTVIYITKFQRNCVVEEWLEFVHTYIKEGLTLIQQDKHQHIPLRFILSPLEEIGKIPKLSKLMAGSRGFRLGVTLGVENLNVLEKLYDKGTQEKIVQLSICTKVRNKNFHRNVVRPHFRLPFCKD